MGSRKVEVALVEGPVEAELVRGLLESYGISADLVSELSHAVFPVRVGDPAQVSIQVEAEDERMAIDLIARHRRSGLVVLSGDREPREA